MRPRLHLDPFRAFDLVLAGAALVIAVAAFVAGGRPHAVVAPGRSVASHFAWRSDYDVGLLLGLAAVGIALIALLALVALVRRRLHVSPRSR